MDHHNKRVIVSCAAEMVASRGANAFEPLLNHPTWIEATYIFVFDQQRHNLVYPLHYQAEEATCNRVDSEGTLVDQNVKDISNSEAGKGLATDDDLI